MSIIRTTRQARNIRPVATERARHSRFKVGEVVFFGGIGWYPVSVEAIINARPFRAYICRSVRGGGFITVTGRGLFVDRDECARHGGVAHPGNPTRPQA